MFSPPFKIQCYSCRVVIQILEIHTGLVKTPVYTGATHPMDPHRVVDADFKKRYDEITSGRPDGRGLVLWCRIEESPHSTEHDPGETPGRGNLPDRATETDSRRKAVMVKRRCKRPPASAAMRAAR